jgi:hypothetical protein
MPTFTEEAIETQARWNEVLLSGGFCGMPEHPSPIFEYQIGEAQHFPATGRTKPDGITSYKLYRENYEGGFYQVEQKAPYYLSVNSDVIEDLEVVVTQEGVQWYLIDIVYSDPVDYAAQASAAFSRFMGNVNWDTARPSNTGTNAPLNNITKSLGTGWTVYFIRWKFVVPDTHLGTYYRIEWDILDEPPDADPFLSEVGSSWTWTGPGTPEDEDSRKSPWQTMAIPEPTLGKTYTRRVVNIRIWSYEGGPFGVLPSFIEPKFP